MQYVDRAAPKTMMQYTERVMDGRAAPLVEERADETPRMQTVETVAQVHRVHLSLGLPVRR